ncbi:MAG TPA: lipocalin-like domain-containing protein [Burkholderiales bacterium]
MSAALTGAWRLLSWSARLSGGGSGLPFGEHPRGVLVYSADGTMCSAFMHAERTPLETTMDELAACRRYWQGLQRDVPPREGEIRNRLLQAALRFNAYAGRYTVDGGRIHHDVEVALFPDWIGKRLTRRFRIEDGKLALSFETRGEQDTLIWERR